MVSKTVRVVSQLSQPNRAAGCSA